MWFSKFLFRSLFLLFLVGRLASAETYTANPNVTSGPDYYRTLLSQLEPGDTLFLPAGTYGERLNLNGLKGTASQWITITGPASGAPAIITTDSTCCNNVQLGDTAYVALKNLTLDSNSEAIGVGIDAINAKGQPTHDILIEDCIIIGAGSHQQTVGISTKSTAWNWTVRRNEIIGAGTGIYFGSSDGSAPFVAGLVENNLFIDTIGYNMQIKYQNQYDALPGMPPSPRRTIIRDNVFLKRAPQSSFSSSKVDGPRPNLLVDGFPNSGSGSDDLYEIFGNFFYQNLDGESLIQAAGRVSIHDNIFVGSAWAAIYLVDHNRALKYATVYNNTIYSVDNGIRFGSTARESSSVVGNAVFANSPISGSIDTQVGNVSAGTAAAVDFVNSPSSNFGSMDFYPLPGALQGEPLDLTPFSNDTGFDSDFNGTAKLDFRFRGAYAGEGSNPGWQLAAERKQVSTAIAPRPPTDLTAN